MKDFNWKFWLLWAILLIAVIAIWYEAGRISENLFAS